MAVPMVAVIDRFHCTQLIMHWLTARCDAFTHSLCMYIDGDPIPYALVLRLHISHAFNVVFVNLVRCPKCILIQAIPMKTQPTLLCKLQGNGWKNTLTKWVPFFYTFLFFVWNYQSPGISEALVRHIDRTWRVLTRFLLRMLEYFLCF